MVVPSTLEPALREVNDVYTPNPPRHRRTRKLPGALTALAAATLIAASPQTVQASPDGGTEFVPTPAETPSERIAAEGGEARILPLGGQAIARPQLAVVDALAELADDLVERTGRLHRREVGPAGHPMTPRAMVLSWIWLVPS